MKILHVITSLRTGGAEKLMVDLLPRLRNARNEVELCVFDGIRTPFYELLERSGIKIHIFSLGGNVYNLLHIFRLYRLMRYFDLVHTHNTAPQFFGAVASFFSDVLMVTTEHNTSNRRRDKIGMILLDRWMYKRYDQIICISQKAEDNLRQWLGGEWSNICTIPNGIDVQKIVKAQPGSWNFYGCEHAKHVALMVAAFRWEKDQKTVIRAYKELPDVCHVVFAGDGDDELMSECKDLANSLGISPRVHFLGQRNDVPSLLKTADVIILSSHFEGLSLSSLEGMASGKPFIASDVDGLHDLVYGYGLLFPHGDALVLAQMIESMRNESKAQLVAERCVQRSRQFDIAIMADLYNEKYTKLL